jgi:hypothetical protein
MAPDTVEVGVEFSVYVRTYGGGCVEKGDTRVEVAGQTISVWSYDIDTGASVCSDVLHHFSHDASAIVAAAGPILLRVYSWEEPGSSPIVVERQLVAG